MPESEIPAAPAGAKNPFVFVVGCPRSGTTLLQRMLDAHPLLSVANDSHFIPQAIDDFPVGVDPALTPALVERVRSNRRFGRLPLPPDALDDAAKTATTYAGLVGNLYTAFGGLKGKPLGGEKTPDYVRKLPRLHGLFPHAKFIHIIRDGRDVTLSTLEWAHEYKGPGHLSLWKDEPVGTCALWWAWQVKLGQTEGAKLGAQYHEVNYEALVANPEAELQKAATFLGLPFSMKMVNFNEGKVRDQIGLSAKEAWLPATQGLRDWRTQMSPRDQELFEALTGDLLTQIGCERKFPVISPEIAERAAFCMKVWNDELQQRQKEKRAEQAAAANEAPAAKAGPSRKKEDPAMMKAIEDLRARGYEVAEGTFKIGRPDQKSIPLVAKDGTAVVAKFYSKDRGATAFVNMQALWQSPFGADRKPPGLPRPIEFLPESGVLVMERLEGRPLAEFTGRNDALFDDSVRLLAALHNCGAFSETKRGSRDIVRSAQRKAEGIAQLTPQYADVVNAAVKAIEAGRVKERELVPSHGDFSPRNVLVGEGRLALIDLDRFQMADPTRDLAYMGTWNWPEALRRGRWPDRSLLERAMEIYVAERPNASIKKAMSFHIAAGLIRRAHSLVTLWPNEAWLVPALAQAAMRELER
jgi:hypothetical protein